MNKPEWRISDGVVPYAEALMVMDQRVADIRAGRERELVWLLEHPPLYTAGTSAKPQDLLQPMRFPVHVAGRGGQYTYHGPGQRVVYAMLDLRARRQDVRRFVPTSKDGPSAPSPASASRPNAAPAGSASGWSVPTSRCCPTAAARGQNRRHRRAHPPLGIVPRTLDQRRA